MSWKESLDKWLTTEPDDGYSQWYEEVIDNTTDDFYYDIKYWLDDYENQENVALNKVFNKWLEKLFNKGYSPIDSVKIIERAFKFYNL